MRYCLHKEHSHPTRDPETGWILTGDGEDAEAWTVDEWTRHTMPQGRVSKYATEEERLAAKRENNRRYAARRYADPEKRAKLLIRKREWLAKRAEAA